MCHLLAERCGRHRVVASAGRQARTAADRLTLDSRSVRLDGGADRGDDVGCTKEGDVAIRAKADPWWDLEGSGVRRQRLRHRIVGGLAFLLAVSATGFSAAAWYTFLAPFVPRFLG
jgi:hypothetical protein